MGTDALFAAILVAQLGSPSFTVRQNADVALRHLGERAAPVLMLHAGDSDPEVRHRIDRLLAATLPGRIDRLLARHSTVDGGLPWADSLPSLHPNRHCLYGRYASDPRVQAATKTEEQKHYPAYRAVTRIWIIDSIRSGEMTFDEADAILAAMVKRCSLWAAGKWMDEASDD